MAPILHELARGPCPQEVKPCWLKQDGCLIGPAELGRFDSQFPGKTLTVQENEIAIRIAEEVPDDFCAEFGMIHSRFTVYVGGSPVAPIVD